jgi:hypothetical protein
MSRDSVERRLRRPPRMRSSVSEKGRERRTASCARRTLAAATNFMADVIFFVFLTDLTRSRSARMLLAICGAHVRCTSTGDTAAA